MMQRLLAACLATLIIEGCNIKTSENKGLYFTLLNSSETNIDFNNKITESDSVNVYDDEYMYNGSGVGTGDFNNDGLQDIFFAGSMVSSKLYINKGNFRFEDVTEKAGLQTNQWCTGVSIVDINNDGFMDIYICSSHSHNKEKRKNLLFINDGDLDMYLLNHRLYDHTANNLAPKDTSGNSPAQDRLYRNDGVMPGQSHPVFHDVSKQAGIKEDGYGLGMIITDVNNDNYPDVYVANDYIANDLLWLNNKDGSFSNIISTSLRHQSYNSMGVDAADINNDCLPDLAVLDMMPENNERKKMMFNVASQEKYDLQQRMGYEPAFVRNMLQLNNGVRKYNNREEPFYSEIGQLAGISETDWSWSVLMADFDNDGWKDIHITNGLAKDVTNNDYAAFKNAHVLSNYTFAGTKATATLDKSTIEMLRKNLNEYGSIKIDNYFFHNNGNLTFSNATAQTGLANPSISQGAAYADLDNDGDLDLVVNNMNQEAFVYRNGIRKSVKDSTNNFITIQLKGPSNNLSGLGSKIWLFSNGITQFLEQSPVRGFSSSVVTEECNIDYTHKESQYYDYGSQRGLLQKYSQLGPCIATGDINGDGLEDFFIGGAAYQSGKIFFQKSDGTFSSKNLVEGIKPEEDLAVALFDADGDKDLDLLISGGSSEFGENSPNNFLRLHNNDGKGNFTLNKYAFPQNISVISKAVTAADYDGDGDMDIFIGGYILPQKYPQFPQSYILQNNKGVFTNVTEQVCPALQNPGMITAALWTDFNNDKKPDLIICGEWMPLRFFINSNEKLTEVTDATGLNADNGMWRSLQAVDVDNDGDLDYIAGNMGLNNKYHTSAEMPVMFYAKDVDKNGSEDLIPAYYIKNNDGKYELFPGMDRNQLAEEFPSIKKKYLLHKVFSNVNMEKLASDFGNYGWTFLNGEITKNVWIENMGNEKFKLHELPTQAQFAPVNTILPYDINDDGNMDLMIAGNEYETDAMIGRDDASYGLVLEGDGKGNFHLVNIVKSGFSLDGDVKDMKLINVMNKGKVVVAAVNNDKVKCFAVKNKNKK